MAETIMREFAKFALEAEWEDLPPSIVQETKMILMDSAGCALGAQTTDRGKMNVALGRRLGGPPEASIIGAGDKVSLSTATMINGENMFTMDFISMIAGGNEPSYVLPAILAMAESIRASGKNLILATTLGLEISARIAKGVLRMENKPGLEAVKKRRTGNAYSNFGAAAGAARLMGLDLEKTVQAMSIAGHLCKVMTHGRYGSAGKRWLAKYGAPGWQGTGAIAAVLYAEMGYTGDTTQLDDPENGFWYFVGYPGWNPDGITDGLGKVWTYNYRMHYKPYPCCSMWHGVLDCFYEIIEKNKLMPDEIESVKAYGRVGMDHPLYGNKDLKIIADAQFNTRYMLSAAAHRVRIGIEWLDEETLRRPEVRSFMDKVTFYESHEPSSRDPLIIPSRCEVVARGQTFTAEKDFSWGTSGTDAAMSQDDLVAKFKHNAVRILTQQKIEGAVKSFTNLENIDNIARLVKDITM